MPFQPTWALVSTCALPSHKELADAGYEASPQQPRLRSEMRWVSALGCTDLVGMDSGASTSSYQAQRELNVSSARA
eukprot:2709264-Alexandrium_andersonii.AAC.1